MPNKTIQRTALILVVCYTFVLLYWMFFAFGRTHLEAEGYRYNLIPFRTIEHFIEIQSKYRMSSFINLIGNVAVFVPFGVLLPLLAPYSLRRWTALYSIGISVLELLQLLTKRGMLDIDDLILNVAGFLIGYGMLALIRKVR